MKPLNERGSDLSDWRITKRNDPRPLDGTVLDGFYSISHEHSEDPNLAMTRFFLHTQELYRAWGYKHETHCSYHAIRLSDDTWMTIPGCPHYTLECDRDTVHGHLTIHTPHTTITYPVSMIDTDDQT